MDDKRMAIPQESAALPHYKNPPVVEVSLSIQFEALAALRSTHLAEFWTNIRERYPRVEDQAPLPSLPPEVFGQQQKEFQPTFTIQTTPPSSRWFYLRQDGSEFIQIQQDRFAYNWRKLTPDSVYPRFETLRKHFVDELGEFGAFVSSKKLGNISPTRSEVVYVDRILSDHIWKDHNQLGKVFRPWSEDCGSILGESPEDARCLLRFIMKDSEKKPVGRLYVSMDPAFQLSDKKPIFIMKLTARANASGDLAEALKCIDLGHEWVVKGFDSLTTDAMHAAWEKING